MLNLFSYLQSPSALRRNMFPETFCHFSHRFCVLMLQEVTPWVFLRAHVSLERRQKIIQNLHSHLFSCPYFVKDQNSRGLACFLLHLEEINTLISSRSGTADRITVNKINRGHGTVFQFEIPGSCVHADALWPIKPTQILFQAKQTPPLMDLVVASRKTQSRLDLAVLMPDGSLYSSGLFLCSSWDVLLISWMVCVEVSPQNTKTEFCKLFNCRGWWMVSLCFSHRGNNRIKILNRSLNILVSISLLNWINQSPQDFSTGSPD